MDRKEIKGSFRELLREDFGIDKKERNLILDVIERLEEVKGKEMTDSEFCEKCKSVYQILKGKEAFKDFIGILKEENKVGNFHNTVY